MITIKVLSSMEGSENEILLEEISNYLETLQIIPNVGDALTLRSGDGKKLGIESTSVKNIMTVKRKWINHGLADVVLVVHYVAW